MGMTVPGSVWQPHSRDRRRLYSRSPGSARRRSLGRYEHRGCAPLSGAAQLGPAPQRITVTIDQVSQLVAEQFPQWADLSVLSVANSGWDNWTFHLGSNMSVRLPSAAE